MKILGVRKKIVLGIFALISLLIVLSAIIFSILVVTIPWYKFCPGSEHTYEFRFIDTEKFRSFNPVKYAIYLYVEWVKDNCYAGQPQSEF